MAKDADIYFRILMAAERYASRIFGHRRGRKRARLSILSHRAGIGRGLEMSPGSGLLHFRMPPAMADDTACEHEWKQASLPRLLMAQPVYATADKPTAM